jgi:hypothetical protein
VRDWSRTLPPRRIAPHRMPSSLRSNSQPGSENGASTSTAFIGAYSPVIGSGTR